MTRLSATGDRETFHKRAFMLCFNDLEMKNFHNAIMTVIMFWQNSTRFRLENTAELCAIQGHLRNMTQFVFPLNKVINKMHISNMQSLLLLCGTDNGHAPGDECITTDLFKLYFNQNVSSSPKTSIFPIFL